MCYVYTNKCTNKKCSKVEDAPILIHHCGKAREKGKQCKNIGDEPVDKEDRQLCSRGNGKGKLRSLPKEEDHHASAAGVDKAAYSVAGDGKAGKAKADHKAVAPKPSMPKVNDGADHKAVAPKPSMSQVNERSIPNANKHGKAAYSQPGQSDMTKSMTTVTKDLKKASIDDHVTDSKLTTQPPGTTVVMPKLSPEPAEWQRWRAQPAEDNASRDSRYVRALKAEKSRPWPLPCESLEKYKARQIKNLGKSKTDDTALQNDFLNWRWGDPNLQASDDKFMMDWILKEVAETRELLKKYPPPAAMDPYRKA